MISLLERIFSNILEALYQPFGFSILLSFLALYFYLYAYHPENAGKGWKAAIAAWLKMFQTSSFFRKLFLLAFITALILFRTLLNRNLWLNPLSNIMGGWGIWETVNGEKQLTTECIENVLMMIPFTGIVMWTFEISEKIVRKSIKLAFVFSLCIETLQLLLRLGTFQISDIVYNTLGGVIGGVVYWVCCRLKRR